MSRERRLPGFLGVISDIAGRDAAIAVALHFGGRDLHVPTPEHLSKNAAHPLLMLPLHTSLVFRICERCAGESVYVPMARRECVVALNRSGMDVDDIAARLGLSPKTVRRYLRRR